jgi:hypothetical protein
MTFVWLSVWGWKEVDFVSLLSNKNQRLDQNVLRNGLWYPKVDPHSFEEYIGNTFCCDILLAGCEDGHLQKSINDHKYRVISFLGGRQAKDVIH